MEVKQSSHRKINLAFIDDDISKIEMNTIIIISKEHYYIKYLPNDIIR